jgi:two-component system chemotaxis sensor kinase CheA
MKFSSVKSLKDEGTEFIFTIPLEEVTTPHKISSEDIMIPLIETTKNYLLTNNQISFKSIEKIKISKNDKINLKKISTFINVRGIITGKFIFSIDEVFLKLIMKEFILDELTKEEEQEYLQDTMSELSNIILGNSIKNFAGLNELITIEIPTIICYEGASIKYPSSEIWAYDLHSEYGTLRLSFVLSKVYDI